MLFRTIFSNYSSDIYLKKWFFCSWRTLRKRHISSLCCLVIPLLTIIIDKIYENNRHISFLFCCLVMIFKKSSKFHWCTVGCTIETVNDWDHSQRLHTKRQVTVISSFWENVTKWFKIGHTCLKINKVC